MSTLKLEEGSNNIEDCNSFFNKNNSKFFQNNSFEKLENVGSTLCSRTYKVFSTKCNKIFILNKILFSQKYTLKDFIADLNQYQRIELHANILKFVSIIEQSTNKAMF
ncbi:234_t:CDS:2, partial [Dentiscutata heterogama]